MLGYIFLAVLAGICCVIVSVILKKRAKAALLQTSKNVEDTKKEVESLLNDGDNKLN